MLRRPHHPRERRHQTNATSSAGSPSTAKGSGGKWSRSGGGLDDDHLSGDEWLCPFTTEHRLSSPTTTGEIQEEEGGVSDGAVEWAHGSPVGAASPSAPSTRAARELQQRRRRLEHDRRGTSHATSDQSLFFSLKLLSSSSNRLGNPAGLSPFPPPYNLSDHIMPTPDSTAFALLVHPRLLLRLLIFFFRIKIPISILIPLEGSRSIGLSTCFSLSLQRCSGS